VSIQARQRGEFRSVTYRVPCKFHVSYLDNKRDLSNLFIRYFI